MLWYRREGEPSSDVKLHLPAPLEERRAWCTDIGVPSRGRSIVLSVDPISDPREARCCRKCLRLMRKKS